jgi:hypothetical protein
MCRFNLSAQELRSVVLEPWSQERWVEFGERKWSPHQATLTVLEGPRIPFGQLTMGRGWRTAERQSREVTEELLAAIAREPGPSPAVVAEGAPRAGTSDAPSDVAGEAPRADPDALATDSLGLELLSHIGSERAPLRRAWELAGELHPGSPASATLALAERAVESLLRRQLIVLSRGEEGAGEAAQARALDEREVAQAIGSASSWADAGVAGGLWMRRE